MRDRSKLTPRQERFVSEYMIDLNASAAARRAGYSVKNSDNISAKLLVDPKVSAAIKAAQYAIAQRNAVTAQRVIEELAAVGFSDLGQLIEFGKDGFRFKPASSIPEAARRAVSSIKVRREFGTEESPPAETVEFKLWDKVSALVNLGKHLGILTEKVEVGGSVKMKIVEEIIDAGAGDGGSREEDQAAPNPE